MMIPKRELTIVFAYIDPGSGFLMRRWSGARSSEHGFISGGRSADLRRACLVAGN